MLLVLTILAESRIWEQGSDIDAAMPPKAWPSYRPLVTNRNDKKLCRLHRRLISSPTAEPRP